MNIEKRKLSELIYADYNPRKALTPTDPEYQKIARSIDEFGYIDPIIINSDNTIIGGHQRATVLKDKGIDEVQVVIVDLPKDKEKALNIALNKISGEWDLQKLKDVLSELEIASFDVAITGFDKAEIDDLIIQLQKNQPIEDDDFDADEEYDKIEQPVSKLGDIWQLGEHRLMCGNSCNSNDVNKLMNGKKSQLIITDPPYNVDYEGVAGKILNDNMSDDSFYNFLFAAFQNMYATAKSGAAIYVFHADTEGINFRTSYKNAGFLMKQCLVWVKNMFVIGRQDYQWRHESILYGWKDGASHYFIDDRTQSTVIDDNDRPNFKQMKKEELVSFITEYIDKLDSAQQSVIYCDKPVKNDEHPTMKPIPLIGKLVKNSSKPGWIVQDLFAGSGSTLIACEKLDRINYAMELDPKNVDVIIKRWETLTGKKAELIK